ncbi:phosphate propanoyltransferase [Marinisporobacter balticus]|uniref:Phosphate propanoyltransferase n=1 Tax=Marinisporobacter balticus TaxID=2018667 RepID=A0A4R2L259_9FIRM|nr:phosphate propanoyltransferase [Marinisporobacter balticus]TCO77959.1 putative phosphotransacetylase [Marinisporobacter balticus]
MDLSNKENLVKIVTEIVKRAINEHKDRLVPIGISNRHIHLSKKDLETLFGKRYTLTKIKDLVQPGQFAAKETVKIIGPKGNFEKVRILGPVRDTTQVEVSLADGFKIGIKVPIRESGKIENTPGIILEGPKGKVTKNNGVIAALRHIHIPPEIAKAYGLQDKQMVDVETEGIRKTVFGNVLVRVSDRYSLEMHIDMDEANSSDIKNGDKVRILKNKE